MSQNSDLMIIASCGFGVASTAMLFLENYDLILHADPGKEHEWTKALQGFTRQYFDDKMITVSANILEKHRDYFIHPQFRRCTDRFKLRPMRKHLRKIGIGKCIMLIGMTYDERERIRESDVKWIKNKYPLVERKITRSDCIRILKRYYPFRVMKSGCIDCFSAKKDEIAFPLNKYFEGEINVG